MRRDGFCPKCRVTVKAGTRRHECSAEDLALCDLRKNERAATRWRRQFNGALSLAYLRGVVDGRRMGPMTAEEERAEAMAQSLRRM